MKTLRVLLITIVAVSLLWSVSNAQVVVKHKPKAPKAIKEKPAKPDAKHVWVAGEWKFNKTTKKYDWKEGHWFAPRPNTIWVSGHWKKVPEGFKWMHGQWKVVPKKK